MSIAVAALVAAWLPFSIIYISALNNHAATMAANRVVRTTAASGHSIVVTSASGVTRKFLPGQPAAPIAAVTTHTS